MNKGNLVKEWKPKGIIQSTEFYYTKSWNSERFLQNNLKYSLIKLSNLCTYKNKVSDKINVPGLQILNTIQFINLFIEFILIIKNLAKNI